MRKRLIQGKGCASIWSGDFRNSNVRWKIRQVIYNFVQVFPWQAPVNEADCKRRSVALTQPGFLTCSLDILAGLYQ